MKRIILVRHAKSSWALPSLNDFDRPLNKRGKRDAPTMGKRLANQKMIPDKIISSPATRAITTARSLAKGLDIPLSKIKEDREIYEASAIGLLGLVRGFKEKWGTVLVVGHMPGLADLAHLLLDNAIGAVPTCCVVEIELAVDKWSDINPGCGRLQKIMTPKDSET